MIGYLCKDRAAALRRWDRVHRLRAKGVSVRKIARLVGIFPSHVSYLLRQEREAVWRPGGLRGAQATAKLLRNEAIIERASEVPPPTLAALAQQFGISRQRVHAIVHRGRMARLEGGGSQS